MHGTLPDHVAAEVVFPSRRHQVLKLVVRVVLLGIGAWLGMVLAVVLALATGLTSVC